MTNEAISAILNYFYDETRSASGTASADRLLRFIDDARDLLAYPPGPPATMEEFDLPLCVSEIIEALSLASGKRVKELVLNASGKSSLLTQDRRSVEQIVTRVLDTALKLAKAGEAPLSLSLVGSEDRVRLAILICEPDLAVRLATWLNADPERVLLHDRGDIPFGVALMVAGKRLRMLGGAADLACDSEGRCTVALDLPSQAPARGKVTSSYSERLALNILVAEDNDESFALTSLVLRNEQVSRARDGQEALRMIQMHRFDVVFMDIHMPGMDGYDLIRSMRDWETQTGNARTPMVVLSSDNLETQQRSAAEFGCTGFLRKPLRRLDLMPLFDRLR
jgi:CheY-like chemotaxis protein